MRLLLDANVSGRRIARALREDGHDVLSLTDYPELEGLPDAEVLALAAREGRILITRNSEDFAPLLRTWAEEGRSHAGCVLIWTLGHHQFGEIVRQLRTVFEARPTQVAWKDLAAAV